MVHKMTDTPGHTMFADALHGSHTGCMLLHKSCNDAGQALLGYTRRNNTIAMQKRGCAYPVPVQPST